MAAPKRRPFEIDRDHLEISRLYLQGRTQTEIAEELKKDPTRDYTLTQQTISRDLRTIQRKWLETSLINFNEKKSIELAKIDTLEREYYREWERSKLSKAKTQTEKSESKGKTKQSAKIVKEDVNGDPRYLQGVQWCIDRRCQLLGLDAPKKMHIAASDVLAKFNFDSLTKDQLQRLANGEEPSKVIPGFKLN